MDSTVLIGAEDVRSGGNAMERAADRMANAASTIEYALRQHEQFLDDWLRRLEDVFAAGLTPGKAGDGNT